MRAGAFLNVFSLPAMAAAAFFWQLSTAQETAPARPIVAAADAADLDFRAFEKSFHVPLPRPADEMSPRESALYLEEWSMDVRRKALAFLSQYPDDPRRWRIAMTLDPNRPRFVLEWGEDDAQGSPQAKAVDRAAAAAWKARINEMKEGLKTAQDLPEDIRKDVAAYAERRTQRKAFFAKWQSGRETAPDFTAYDINGKPVKLSDYRGKVVVLDFWASWCIPCKAAMPHAQELANTYREQGVVVIASGTNDLRPDFERFVKKNIGKYPDIVWTHDRAGKNDDRASKALYGVLGIPAQFIVGRDGRVVDVIVGNTKGTVILDGALAKAGVKVQPDIMAQSARQLAERS